MSYEDAIKVITVVLNQHKHGYTITQGDYNSFLDALNILSVALSHMEVTK